MATRLAASLPSRAPQFLSYRPKPSDWFDPMRNCNVRSCSKETEWLVNDGLSRLWQPRCSRHMRLFVPQAQAAGSTGR